MKVNEIFASIEGECKRAGLPCTFIRLYGCNLHCSYCDTRYACENNEYTVMSIPNIINRCIELGIPNITVTGGEPMIHPGIESLLQALMKQGFNVNVETNGTCEPFNYLFDARRCESIPGTLLYIVDYKSPSSGMNDEMRLYTFLQFHCNDVLKFVVGNEEDMDCALALIEQLDSQDRPAIYFSPVFGQIEPAEIVNYLIGKKLFDCKVQLQLHKFIWEPNKRGV